MPSPPPPARAPRPARPGRPGCRRPRPRPGSPGRRGPVPSASPGSSRPSWPPMVAAATGTPSWAAASMAQRRPADAERAERRGARRTAPTPRQTPSTIIDGMAGRGRADLERGAEPDEEQRAEEALGDREQLLGHPPRLADRRDREPDDEAGQHDRHVQRHRQRGHREQHGQADPQLERERAAPRRRRGPAPARPLRSTRREQRRTTRPRRRPARRPPRARRAPAWAGSIASGSSDDAGRVGDRDLREQLEHVRSPPSPSESDDRQDQRRRRRRHQHGVQRRVVGADQREHGVPERRTATAPTTTARTHADPQRGPQPPVADRHVGAGHEHHQREADVGQEGERRVARRRGSRTRCGPSTTPASSSPRTTGRCQPRGSASSGPSSPTKQTTASTVKPTAEQ